MSRWYLLIAGEYHNVLESDINRNHPQQHKNVLRLMSFAGKIILSFSRVQIESHDVYSFCKFPILNFVVLALRLPVVGIDSVVLTSSTCNSLLANPLHSSTIMECDNVRGWPMNQVAICHKKSFFVASHNKIKWKNCSEEQRGEKRENESTINLCTNGMTKINCFGQSIYDEI